MVNVLHYLSGLADIKAGVETYILNLYDRLDKEEYSFSILTRNAKQDSPLYELFVEHGIKVYEISFPSLNVTNTLLFKKELNRFFEKIDLQFDFLHMHGCDDPFVVECAKKHGIKVAAVHVHSIVRENKNVIKRYIKTYTSRNNIRYSDYLFACSNDAGKSMFKDRPYEVLKNSIDTQKFKFDAQKREELREKYHIDEHMQVIGYCGRFSEIKNLPFLLEVFMYVRKKKNETILIMIGNGECKSELVDLAKKFDIEKCVIFTGEIENVNELLSAMDLYLQTSIKEGFSISALEAQCNGLKTVISSGFPKEIEITDLVKRIPLEYSPEDWSVSVCALLDSEQNNRATYATRIKEAGYDSGESIRQISGVYRDAKND